MFKCVIAEIRRKGGLQAVLCCTHSLVQNSKYVIRELVKIIIISSLTGCYGLKPESVRDSWTCARCTTESWVVVSGCLADVHTQMENNG